MHPKILARARLAARAAIIAGLVSIVYASAEALALGLLGYSSILMADMIHSILDALMSFTTGFSIYILIRGRRSSRFPWGLYKVESLAAMSIAIITAIFMIEILSRSLLQPSRTPPHALPILVAGFVASYAMYRYELSRARRALSAALMADAMHARSDALLGIASILGISAELASSSQIPQILAIITISAYVFKDAVTTLKEAVLSLLDATPSAEDVEAIVNMAEEVSGMRVRRAMLKKAGSFITGIIVLEADSEMSIGGAYKIARRTRARIYRTRPDVVNLVITILPARKREASSPVARLGSPEGLASMRRRGPYQTEGQP